MHHLSKEVDPLDCFCIILFCRHRPSGVQLIAAINRSKESGPARAAVAGSAHRGQEFVLRP
eukprot:SAG31_NODE_11985_length_980_cov_0.868331_1_plen_60_part_10